MPRPASRILLAVASTIVVLAAAEVFVRACFHGEYGPLPSSVIPDEATVFRPNRNLEQVFKFKDFEMQVRTDAFGARLGDLGEVEPDKDLIVVSGDSFAFGWGVSTPDSMPARLDRLIDEQTQHHARVVNLAVPGYSTFQSARRLRQFLEAYPAARLRVLLFVHCFNDLRDNARLDLLGVMNGFLTLADRKARGLRTERSFSHFWNLLQGVGEPDSSGEPGNEPEDFAPASSEPFDPVYGFRNHLKAGVAVPEQFRIGHTVFHSGDFTTQNTSYKAADEREAPSELQRQLMREAVLDIHQAVQQRGIVLLHTHIPTSPVWFVDAVNAIVEQCPHFGNRVYVNYETFTSVTDIVNAHSGEHYTPEFNASWAEGLAKAVRRLEPALYAAK